MQRHRHNRKEEDYGFLTINRRLYSNMTWHPDFDRAFHPRAVAIVGASGSDISALPGGGFIGNFQKLGFEGRLYPVNLRLKEMLGLPAYPNLVSIPEPIDLVIICTPAKEVPAVLEDCIAAKARNVHIFSAGFRETGEEEGEKLEEKVKEIALRGELRIIGPNCMGINVPRANMQTIHGFPIESGEVAFLSQSGGHAIQFSSYAPRFGIGFSKIISYGNGCVVDSPDLLEYLATDPETKVITLYMEGVKDGRRLMKQVSEINRTKPVIIWKGGTSKWGSRAAISHTGSLAGSLAVWDSFFKQTGAVPVSSLDELTDVTMTFLYLNPPPGRRTGLLLGGGGRGVTAADFCAAEGLEVPVLTLETRKQLSDFIPQVGNSVRNPIDAYMMLQDPALFERALDIIAGDPLIDIILVDLDLNILLEVSPTAIGKMETIMDSFARQYSSEKLLVAILGTSGGKSGIGAERSRLQKEFVRAGIGVYRTLPRACRALAKFARYHEFQQNP